MSSTLALLFLGFLAEPDPVVLTGRVVQLDGTPAAGAEVLLAQVLMPPGGPTGRNGTRLRYQAAGHPRPGPCRRGRELHPADPRG